MRKKIYLISMLILMSLLGCARSNNTTIKTVPVTHAPVVKSIVKQRPVETSSIPAFDKTAVMLPSGRSVPVLMYHSISYQKDNPVRLPIMSLKSS